MMLKQMQIRHRAVPLELSAAMRQLRVSHLHIRVFFLDHHPTSNHYDAQSANSSSKPERLAISQHQTRTQKLAWSILRVAVVHSLIWTARPEIVSRHRLRECVGYGSGSWELKDARRRPVDVTRWVCRNETRASEGGQRAARPDGECEKNVRLPLPAANEMSR
jgi:hypothetical protein